MPQLEHIEVIEKHKIGRYNYYVNRLLVNTFMTIPETPGNIEPQSSVTIKSTG